MKTTTKNFPPKEEGKLNIYYHVSENSGVGFYREYLPALKLRENKIANTMINDFQWGKGDQKNPNPGVLFDIANWADLIVVGRLDIPQFYATWGGIREFFHIPIIMDTDDNVHNVRPSNPGYMGYHPSSENLLWNEYALSKVFDGVTVSTDNLKQFYKKYNPRIFVCPNNIDMKWWNSFEVKKQQHNTIRFGFIGSAAHGEGVQMIKKSVLRLLETYPNAEFCTNHIFEIYFKDIPENLKKQITYVQWIDLVEFPQKLQELNLDFALAPLADNLFNRAKSNLRWMELAASKVPSIVSPVEAYKMVKDGVDAIVAKPEDWFEKLDMLYLNKNKRLEIAENAYKRIDTEFNIDRNIQKWDNVYSEVVEKYHAFFGRKKRFAEISKGKYKELKF